MPSYLYTANNYRNKSVSSRVEAESLQQARKRLEALGYHNITFLDDDVISSIAEQSEREHPGALGDELDAEEEIKLRNGLIGNFFFFIKYHFILYLLAGFLIWLGFQGDSSSSFMDWLIYGVAACIILFSIGLGFPMYCYSAIQTHNVQGNWRRQMLWVRFMALFPWVVKFRAIRNELAFRKIEVWVNTGKQEQALLEWQNHKPQDKAEQSMWYSRYASLLAKADRLDDGWQAAQAAFDKSDGSNTMRIDMARYRIRYIRDADLAESIVNEAEQEEIFEMAKPYLSMIKGAIALERCNYSHANNYFNQAIKQTASMKGVPMIEGHRNEVLTYQVLALAGLGKQDEAHKLFKSKIKRFLTNQNDTRFLNRCLEALNLTNSSHQI